MPSVKSILDKRIVSTIMGANLYSIICAGGHSCKLLNKAHCRNHLCNKEKQISGNEINSKYAAMCLNLTICAQFKYSLLSLKRPGGSSNKVCGSKVLQSLHNSIQERSFCRLSDSFELELESPFLFCHLLRGESFCTTWRGSRDCVLMTGHHRKEWGIAALYSSKTKAMPPPFLPPLNRGTQVPDFFRVTQRA